MPVMLDWGQIRKHRLPLAVLCPEGESRKAMKLLQLQPLGPHPVRSLRMTSSVAVATKTQLTIHHTQKFVHLS